jgi:hypothetical protein
MRLYDVPGSECEMDTGSQGINSDSDRANILLI